MPDYTLCPNCHAPVLAGEVCLNCAAIRDVPKSPAVYQSEEYGRLMQETYAPLGAWSICGNLLLFCIPLVGLIFAIVFACGGCRKKQKSSLARGYLLFLVVVFLVALLAGGLLVLAGALIPGFLPQLPFPF